MMDELKEIAKELGSFADSKNDTIWLGELLELKSRLDEIIDSTAFLIPKCPKCDDNFIIMSYHGEDYYLIECLKCLRQKTGKTPTEAAAAFGRKG